MKPEDINRAIAEHCGWRYAPAAGAWHLKGRGYDIEIPNYHEDLNAMHEAEKTLSSIECANYRDKLEVNSECFDDMHGGCIDWQLVHATAAQRAEAFLQTFGKWKDQ